ncbi:PREDICTED: putative uncharacterized protein DDB_G0282133 [Branchiostoma belcheri]|uniref:Ig-like domain-containing protein n=1 Tax=Branchiostoma belcheri TaxID=7741 RepID=A0A6P4ZBH9_BRABE|nr:PREDICTED: putative uncharacterized protein DDB_G0282133 [Branchiostoma belcheri]
MTSGHDQTGQDQSNTITESNMISTATLVTNDHYQTGRSQTITESNTHTITTATAMTSGHDQTGQGPSKANNESNTHTTATVMTSGHDQTGQDQSNTITESNTNTTATVMTNNGHHQYGNVDNQNVKTVQGPSKANNESNTHTTATVMTSGQDQTGQDQSNTITESNTNTTATVMTNNGHHQYGNVDNQNVKTVQGPSKANNESNTHTTATAMTSGHDQTGQERGQSQTITRSLDSENLSYVLVESSNTPYPMTVRGMVGDRVTLRGKFQESLDGVIAITWSKIDSADGGSRNAVAIWSPSGKDARDMTFDPLKERTALNRDGSLTLQPAVSADQGLYVQTVLIDGVGQKEYYVAVEIHVPPTVRLSMPRRGEAVEHTTLSIHCSVENTSALVSPIYWTKDGSIIDTSLRMSVTLKSGDNIRNTSLVIPYVERKDGGNYSCVAEYLTGFQAASVLLDVLYAAKIINISNPIVPFVGESVELLCQAEVCVHFIR